LDKLLLSQACRVAIRLTRCIHEEISSLSAIANDRYRMECLLAHCEKLTARMGAKNKKMKKS